MNDYQGLAEHLAQRQMGMGTNPPTSLPKFLRSAKGRDAARAVVNNIIMNNRVSPGVRPPTPTHQEIMQGLMASMNSEGIGG